MIVPQNATVPCSVWTDVCHCIWFRVKTLYVHIMHFKMHTFKYSQHETLHEIKQHTTQTLSNPEDFTAYVQRYKKRTFCPSKTIIPPQNMTRYTAQTMHIYALTTIQASRFCFKLSRMIPSFSSGSRLEPRGRLVYISICLCPCRIIHEEALLHLNTHRLVLIQ